MATIKDKIFRVEISGYVIQKEYLNHPSEWDWSKVMARWQDFVDIPNIKITAMVEDTNDQASNKA